MDKERTEGIIAGYRLHEKDTGSSEVQIALLSKRISHLSAHLTVHKKDQGCRVGLVNLVGQRRQLLAYLQRVDAGRYSALVSRLGLRR